MRLRTQLILLFVLLVGFLFFTAGVYVDWQLRRVMEQELDARLITVAKIAAVEAARLPLQVLQPGADDSRSARRLRQVMLDYTHAANLAHLVIVGSQRRVLFDSRSELKIGQEYVRLRFDALELDAAFSGTARAAPLFYDSAQRPFKAAYAPVRLDDAIAAAICVEGSAGSLKAIRETRRLLLTIGLLALVAAIVLAAAISQQITGPLEKLKHAAEAIGQGDYQAPIEKSGSSEIRFLAQTLDEMKEAILQRQRRLQMMLGGIAHEIRNPLGGIELFVGLLQKRIGTDLRPQVDRINDEVQHLKKIVSDFLEYARPTEPKLAAVDLAAVLQDVQAILADRDSAVSWKIDIEPGCRVQADPEHVRRILVNLLQNGIEAVHGRPQAAIDIRVQRAGNAVETVIRDNGPGIAADHRDKVFEPFFTTRSQGTGLGLALARQLAEENHGAVELLASDEGAAVVVRLPFFGNRQS